MQVFWNDSAVPEFVSSYSPSWKKPRLFVEELAGRGVCHTLVHAEPVTEKDLCSVHHPKYVRGVLTGTVGNGFGGKEKSVAASLLYTNGIMLEAAKAACKGVSSCAPVSGFHHANYTSGGGFCTFNGVALAAAYAHHNGKLVGVLDCDMHYGNGTDGILRKLGLTVLIPHFTFGGTEYSDSCAHKFNDHLPQILKDEFGSVQVLIYQAGADPHVDDPLGGALTTEQMRLRDEQVFSFCKQHKIAVVWNLAGGYQPDVSKVLDLHMNTVVEFQRSGL